MPEPAATSASSSEAGIAITRVFEAPRALVFKAWTEPERFAQWFGGRDAEVPPETVSMDVRPGGEWKATMLAGPERGEIPWHGSFKEVEEPSRLELTLSDRPTEEYELITVVFNDLGDGRTEMVFEQTGGHMDAAGYEQAKTGWIAFFDAMDAQLAKA